jgi:hypothetical protein
MSTHLEKDGSLIVTANPFYFILTGVRSAVVGAALSYAAREWLSLEFLSWSIAAVFGLWTIRALIQGVFVPSLVSLRFGEGYIEGPKVSWLFRDRVHDLSIDWDVSGEKLGRLILQHPNGNQIFTRLAWYAPEDRAVIAEQVEFRRQRAVLRTPAN